MERMQLVDDTLKTPDQWCIIKRLLILDPDGWRERNAPSWGEPISEGEFDRRAAVSTTDPARRA